MSCGHHLAIYNFGIHVAPYGDPAVDGFIQREPLNFEAARRAIGYVGRSGYRGEPGPTSWGEQVFPRFLNGSGHDTGPSSLSLWEDVESLMAFSYSGVHAEALKNARNWNVRQEWPALVLFWVEAGQHPVWVEAVRRFERLADDGPSAAAFTFKQPYDPEGRPYAIDRARVKAISAANAEGQADLMQLVRGLPA
ncbi:MULTISPECIES: DUF3291 domain-containing protein [Alphaproteobacteria]|uniref:DUF3291 domain-containing protein n=2 Tax=Alphaproteobacteria TaxID=28211 RepID=A0A512HLM8_9HYPH|nr:MULTISPECIES: DUF3291 domain-containing protein [Alphaproteobacteria]GEO86356.1 hypothetical protein RNA01_32880 [Ciceribacter naphthalenivorans]GLR21838.1 hypothetical protein GCM10007920_16250 [Ciceribacter naphthalenivorans]GLT04694.1 hypothetical protein GCM10007926_16250 [Sphingomonas psychrolutea]